MRRDSGLDKFFQYSMYLITLFLIGLIIYAPVKRGMFFREDYLRFFPWIGWTGLVLAGLGLFYWNEAKRLWHLDADVLLFFVTCLYWLSTLWAVSKGESLNGAIKYTAYFLVFMIARYLGQTPLANRLLRNGLIASGVVASMVGLLSAAGILKYPSAVVSGKIYGSFQYPNALAAYAMFIFFLCLEAWTESSDFKKPWAQWGLGIIYSLASFTLASVVVLSYSRATWIIFAVSCFAYFIFLPKGIRADSFWRFLIPLLATVSVNSPLAAAILKNDYQVTKKYLLIGAGLTVGLEILRLAGSLLLKKVQGETGVSPMDLGPNTPGLSKRRAVYISIIAVCLVTVAVIGALTTSAGEKLLGKIVPPAVVQRFKSISILDNSLLARYHATLDALRIGRDHPFGLGAGGWEALYHTYQRTLYWFTETHNHFAQVLVETGFLGLMFYGLFWLGLLYASIRAFLFFRRSRRNPIGALAATKWFSQAVGLGAAVFSLGLHSSADFDLSLPSISIGLFAAIGLFLSHAEANGPILPTIPSLATSWLRLIKTPNTGASDQPQMGAEPKKNAKAHETQGGPKARGKKAKKRPKLEASKKAGQASEQGGEDLRWLWPALGILVLVTMAIFIIKPCGTYFRGMAYGGAGVYYLAKGDIQQGREYLQTAMKYDPHTSSYAMDLARTYVMEYQNGGDSGSKGMVKMYLQLARKLDPLNLEDRGNGAVMLYTVGLYDDSVDSAKEAVRLCPLDKGMYDLLSNCMQSAIAQHLDAWQKASDSRDDKAAQKEVDTIKGYIAYANGIPGALSAKKERVTGTYAKVWNPGQLNLTHATSFLLGQVAFLEGNSGDAVKYLTEAGKNKDMANAVNAWLLSLSRATGISVPVPKEFKPDEKSIQALSRAYGMAK